MTEKMKIEKLTSLPLGMITILPVTIKASWVHCQLCGGDDHLAADWVIKAGYTLNKRSIDQGDFTICGSCLRFVARSILDALEIDLPEELEEEPETDSTENEE